MWGHFLAFGVVAWKAAAPLENSSFYSLGDQGKEPGATSLTAKRREELQEEGDGEGPPQLLWPQSRPPQNSQTEVLTPNVPVSGDGAVKEINGYEIISRGL